MVTSIRGKAVVVDGKRFGVIFLAAVVSTVCFLLLTATPSIAQNSNDGAGENQYNNQDGGQNEDCSGAEEVETVTGTGNQQTPEFDISGDTFRISFDTTEMDSGASGFLGITVNDENGDFVSSATQQGSGSGETFVNEGPGNFSLDITAVSLNYTITVEDCTESGQDSNNQNNQDSSNQDRDNDVIRNTIPNKPLPPTGGWPVYALVASSILAGAGLLGFRLGIWRGRR